MLFLGCWSVIPRCFIFHSDLKDGNARPWCGRVFLTGKALLLRERMAGRLPLVDKKGHVPWLHLLQW